MENLWNTGIQVTLAAQSIGPLFVKPMKFISMLGVEGFYILFLFIFYWCIDTSMGIRLGVMLLLSDTVNTFFKLLFHHPRPYWYSTSVNAYGAENSFGLPSGHAQHAVSVWGMLAALSKKRPVQISAVAVILLISFSRIYLGVHFFTDVLLGWIIGLLLLYTVLKLAGPAVSRLEKLSLEKQLAMALLVSAAALAVQLIPLLFHRGWVFPDSWRLNILASGADTVLPDPRKISGIVSVSGTILGFGAGLALMRHYGGYRAAGSLKQKIIRLIAGFAGVAVLYIGLKAILPGGASAAAVISRYTRYALLGLWATFIAPYLFIRLGLAEREN